MLVKFRHRRKSQEYFAAKALSTRRKEFLLGNTLNFANSASCGEMTLAALVAARPR
jgi:hypothetical protein